MQKTTQTFNWSTPALGALATLVILGMLTAFHSVVQGAVKNGEVHRQAIAVQSNAVQRCKMLRHLPARSSCLQQTDVVALATP